MCIKGSSAWSDDVPKKEPYRLSMEDFNRICLDCGLTPDVEKNKEYLDEASYFTITHPLSDKPIEVAAYEDFIDDDSTFVRITAPRNKLHLALSGFDFYVIDTDSPRGITEYKVRKAIANVKQFLDAEYEARKQKTISFEGFINYLSKTSACWKNTTVELSCPFNEFMEKIENASVHFKVGDVTATFKQEKAE